MASKKYKSNFLKKVILRVDFERIELASLGKFYNAELKKSFSDPLKKESLEVGIESNFTSGEIKQVKTTYPAWISKSLSGTKKFEVSEKYLFIEYDVYEDSTELLSDTKNIVVNFLATFDVKTINRIGLRYINEITIDSGNPIDWDDYINENLLGSIKFSQNLEKNTSRAFSTLIFKEEDADVSFRYGIWNKQYPSMITQKEFVLDYDCFTVLPINPKEEDIEKLISNFNTYSETLFEASISDKLRKLMNK
jgi:uncharacterized protein (TIGR04255 family)